MAKNDAWNQIPMPWNIIYVMLLVVFAMAVYFMWDGG
ncbi:uncharacterized protein G2W53_017181 [Senna tora]|uniref:Uncharacterized protein n=1 Tax=Senna tora TaxID=362788 RepID=A0A834TRE4_9FABA|nr:uncharacterized protein G2W53_017181 [Senna tora]